MGLEDDFKDLATCPAIGAPCPKITLGARKKNTWAGEEVPMVIRLAMISSTTSDTKRVVAWVILKRGPKGWGKDKVGELDGSSWLKKARSNTMPLIND